MKITLAFTALSIIAWLIPNTGFAFQAAVPVDPATNTTSNTINAKNLAESHPHHPKAQLQLLRSQIETLDQVRRRVLDELEVEMEVEGNLVGQIEDLEKQLLEFEWVADPKIVSQLIARRIELMIDIGGLKARQEAQRGMGDQAKIDNNRLIQQQVAIESLREQREMQHQLMAIAEKRLGIVKSNYETGQASSSQVADSETQVLLARMKLLELEEKINTTTLVVSITDSMPADRLDLVEKEWQLKSVEQLLQQVAASRPLIAKRDELAARLERIRSARQEGIAQGIRNWASEYADLIFQAEFLSQKLENLDN